MRALTVSVAVVLGLAVACRGRCPCFTPCDAAGGAGQPAVAERPAPSSASPAVPHDPFPGEKHLKNIRQLTFAGENAEAYWSNAGDRLVFQTTRPPYTADQIFVMAPDGSNPTRVST